MVRHWPVAAAALALLLVCLVGTASAVDLKFPALTGRVVDNAGILKARTEQTLTGWLKSFEQQTGKQVVVATVKDLQGVAIEDYGYQLGRQWGIGEKGKNTGAILLIAPNQREVRIEVGYGLEGDLTDALSRTIIEQQIVPAFKQGDYDAGVLNGTAAILKTLGWTGHVVPVTPRQRQGSPDLGALGFFGFIFIFLILRGLFVRRRPGIWGRRSRGGPWGYWGGGWGGGSGGSFGGGGFSGGGGSFGGGGATGRW
ncbi:MAG: methanol dehydrogenase [Alphaproteobacteria bacterium]|nr:methanol dehydrogenase [Alphaproteobacteria bacterium]